MNDNFVIQVDTREQEKGNDFIIKYFNDNNIPYIRSKLYVGDYTLLHNQTVCIDKKKDIMELANCMHKDHIRFREECDRAKENGIKLYILIIDEYIYNLEGVQYYKIPTYKGTQYKTINGVKIATHHKGDKRANFDTTTLMKSLKTFEERHGCKFVFTKKEKCAEKILKLLGVKNDQ